jgi:hypothetical protein
MIQRSRQKSDEEKALYHQHLGAGKRRVRRQFLGLTDAEKVEITALLQKGMERRAQKA